LERSEEGEEEESGRLGRDVEVASVLKIMREREEGVSVVAGRMTAVGSSIWVRLLG
jgi:hypothetical protein